MRCGLLPRTCRASQSEGSSCSWSVGCHSGINLGGQDYFPFGVVERPGSDILPPGDKGRFQVTKTASDEYVFRAVPLRNVELTAPYFHSGKVWNLEQAVAIMGVAQLGKELTPEETGAIAAFLRALTGQQPRVELPLLPPSTARSPGPTSRKELTGAVGRRGETEQRPLSTAAQPHRKWPRTAPPMLRPQRPLPDAHWRARPRASGGTSTHSG